MRRGARCGQCALCGPVHPLHAHDAAAVAAAAEQFRHARLALEPRALRLALNEWAPALRSSIIHVVGDSQGVRDILDGGAVKRSPPLQREFIGILAACLKFDLILSPGWWSSEDNALCDAGSRLASPLPADAARYTDILRRERQLWAEANPVPWALRVYEAARPDVDRMFCDVLADLPMPQVRAKRACPPTWRSGSGSTTRIRGETCRKSPTI